MMTIGIEEEFVFLDPASLRPAEATPPVQAELAKLGFGPNAVHNKVFRSPVE